MPQPIDHTDILIGSPGEHDEVSVHLEARGEGETFAVLSKHETTDGELICHRQLLRSDGLDIRVRIVVLAREAQPRPAGVGSPKLVQGGGDPLAEWKASSVYGGQYSVRVWAEDGHGAAMRVSSRFSGGVARVVLDGGTGAVSGVVAFSFFEGGTVEQTIPKLN